MKNIFKFGLLAVVLAAFTFTSCSKDDDEIKSDLIGKWIGTSTELYCGKILMSKDTHTSEKYDSWEFKSNGKAERIDKSTGSISKHETYTFSLIDNSIELTNDISKEKTFYDFIVYGNDLTLSSTWIEKGYTYVQIQNYIRKK